jgi:hypothetical protein
MLNVGSGIQKFDDQYTVNVNDGAQYILSNNSAFFSIGAYDVDGNPIN